MSFFFPKESNKTAKETETFYVQITVVYQVPHVAMHIKIENDRLCQTNFKVTQTLSSCLIMTEVTRLSLLG